MKLEEVRLILKRDCDYSKRTIGNVDCLNIINKYAVDKELGAEHDQIWFGTFEETAIQMTEDELVLLSIHGFFEDEDSWSTYV